MSDKGVQFDWSGAHVELWHERESTQGGARIAVHFPRPVELTLRLSLTDAESLGEAIIRCVREAEEHPLNGR